MGISNCSELRTNFNETDPAMVILTASGTPNKEIYQQL